MMAITGKGLNSSLAAAYLILVSALLSACGSGNSSNSNSPGSNTGANSAVTANGPASAPSPASEKKKMESFTADALMEALKKDRSEVDERLSYQEISISGPVKVVDNHNIEFQSKDGGRVNCSLSIDSDKAALQKLSEQASGSPSATAIGTYKMSVPPSAGKNWYVGLNQCRIEAAG